MCFERGRLRTGGVITMIIWNGWGILIGILGVACLYFTNLIVNTQMHDEQYYTAHGWPKLLALWLAAAISWPVGVLMNKKRARTVQDPVTGRAEVLQSGGEHSLFFVPVEYFWLVYLVLGVVFFFVSGSGEP
jgi:drug/metabolite transporter (DMT)-like permease